MGSAGEGGATARQRRGSGWHAGGATESARLRRARACSLRRCRYRIAGAGAITTGPSQNRCGAVLLGPQRGGIQGCRRRSSSRNCDRRVYQRRNSASACVACLPQRPRGVAAEPGRVAGLPFLTSPPCRLRFATACQGESLPRRSQRRSRGGGGKYEPFRVGAGLSVRSVPHPTRSLRSARRPPHKGEVKERTHFSYTVRSLFGGRVSWAGFWEFLLSL